MAKKIGIMGGTFNPIHNAHIMMAQAAYEQYALDEVWFMPSKNPPHKKKKDIAGDIHRKRMIQFAIDDIPCFRLSELELLREGTTYTSDTMCQIQKENPGADIYFILGGDSLIDLKKWHKPKTILKHCHILAAPRGRCTGDALSVICEKTGKELGGEISPLSMPDISISSRMIRKKIRESAGIRGYCPEKVDIYIHLHGLYGCRKKRYAMDSVKPELYQALASCLRPKRYYHTLGVAHTAASLASCYGEDVRRAELAGMLHDCAKYYTGEEMIALCQKKGIDLSQPERENTALIHGKLGAWLAGKRYGVKDKEVLSAIRYHTTGRPGMTTLEKILFIADYIEPCREMEVSPYSLDDIRKESFRNLDAGLLMVLENTLSFLSRTGRVLDPATGDTYQYYKKMDTEV